MTTGSRIIDFRRATGEEPAAEPMLHAVESEEWSEAEPEPTPPGRDRAIAIIFALLALGWLAVVGWIGWTQFRSAPPTPADAASFVAMASAPLALIGVGYLLAMRNSRREAGRFARSSAALRADAHALESALASAADRLEENRVLLAEQTASFMGIGEDAAARLKIVSDAMQGEVDTLGRQSHALKAAATAARADMSVLLADLPKAQVQTRKMTEDLREAGLNAHENAAELGIQLTTLSERGREADEIAGGAARRLAAHLARMESTSETAGARLESAAGQMTEAVDAALARAAEALEEARRGMEAQGAAMLAMVGQTQAALGETGDSASRAIAERVEDVNARIGVLGETLAGHAETSRALSGELAEALTAIDGQLAALGEDGTARTAALSDAVHSLAVHADGLNNALATGGGMADTLIARSEALFTGLDANARELDENLPAAFDRLDSRIGQSQALLAQLTPEAEKLEMTAVSAANRLAEIDQAMAVQRASIDDVIAEMDARIAANRDAVSELQAAIGGAGDQAQRFAEGVAPQLVEALVRVRETAVQASERAKESLASIVPESAAALAQASDRAMAEVIRDRVAAQMAEMTAAAERAVASAQGASERLMRQMLTIADTSAQVEQRIGEHNEEGFSRRVSLLIESLNSTSIDVTKVFSNDVTDSAWAAYLKGDRGVFTRRAVRLLDNGEVREIARHYDNEPEFRDHVNRYIHDFEAILRNVLATRDGSPLGVTLLSSDMGKLYVALAQAIDRLRA